MRTRTRRATPRRFGNRIVLLLGVGTQLWSCSPEFDSCEDTRSCIGETAGAAGAGVAGAAGEGGTAAAAGTSATGGSAGSGGSALGGLSGTGGTEELVAGSAGESDGGAGQGTRCRSDENCKDESFCNGEETCDDGQCVDGVPPCENRDPDHCSVKCEEGNSGATCVFEALDEDGDGFGTVACEEEPGSDCDDEDEDVNPDAVEECDDFDNDCDGKLDTQDGVELAGETLELADGTGFDVAPASPKGGEFLIVHGRSELGGIYATTVSVDGSLIPSEAPLFAPGNIGYGTPAISSGGMVHALVYPASELPVNRLHFRTLALEGSLSDPTPVGEVNKSTYDLAWRSASEDWLVAAAFAQRFHTSSVAEDLSVTAGGVVEQPVSVLRVATTGDEAALVWQNLDTSRIEWASVSASLEIGASQELTRSGYQPDITGTANGYAIAWTTGSGLGLVEIEADGSEHCSKDVDLELASAANLSRVALANTERGLLALVTSEDTDQVILLRFDADCEPVDLIHLEPTAQPGNPVVAVNANRIALGWNSAATDTIHVRSFSDRLCE